MENTLTLMTLIGLMNTDGELEDPVIRCTTRCFETWFFQTFADQLERYFVSDGPNFRSPDLPITGSPDS